MACADWPAVASGQRVMHSSRREEASVTVSTRDPIGQTVASSPQVESGSIPG